MPVPVPASAMTPEAGDVVSPTGAGFPMSVHVQVAGHACAGGGAAIDVTTGPPIKRLRNDAVPVLPAAPEFTARPWTVVAGRSMTTDEPGTRWKLMPSLDTPALNTFPVRWTMTEIGLGAGVWVASVPAFWPNRARYEMTTCASLSPAAAFFGDASTA